MLRKLIVITGVVAILATLGGCEAVQKAFNPVFSADFSIVVSSTAERNQIVQINGVPQGFILSPPPSGSLSHDYMVNIEVKDLDYWGRDGNQDYPFQAYVTVSLFDTETGVQSRARQKTVYADRANVFNFTESDFR